MVGRTRLFSGIAADEYQEQIETGIEAGMKMG